MKKILLTGGSGFIGSEILNELSNENIFYVILRKNNHKIKQNNKIKKLIYKNFDDLNRKLKKIKIDIVIHCATHYVKNHKYDDLAKLVNSNVLFGNVILENLKKMNVKKFIYFSTVWENYDGIKNNFFNLYASYKKSFKNLITYYKKLYPKIIFLNLNLSDTFGVNDKRLKIVNILKRNLKEKRKIKIISKNLFLNLLNVKDVVNAVKILIKKKHNSSDYNIINNKNYSIFEIIYQVNKKSYKKIEVDWASNEVLKNKFFKLKKLKEWKPENSNLQNIVDTIVNKK